MSYYAEFDRVFIRSVCGYTPLWLLGDSSVTEGRGRSTRMYRRWSVFQSLIGVTEEELLTAVEKLKGSSEHWKRGGKWVDDEGLVRWVKSGCKHAVVLEDLLKANERSYLPCVLRDHNGRTVLSAQVHNTLELEDWIYQAKRAIAADSTLFPVITPNYGERLRHPGKDRSRNPEEKVVLKRGKYYLSEHDDKGSTWVIDRKRALIFSAQEANDLIGKGIRGKIVSASVLDAPCNFIVAYDAHDSGPTRYLCTHSRSGFKYTLDKKSAKRYSTKAAAQRAMESAKQKIPSSTYEVLELDEKAA